MFLEKWKAGSSEPKHSHLGDDMTIVVEGSMQINFYKKTADGACVQDGEPVLLTAGMTGYIPRGRVHDVRYIEDCKLVYVHDKTFGFIAEEPVRT